MAAMGAKRGWRGMIGGALAGALLLLSASAASALEALPAPQAAPILIVSGGVAVANQGDKAAFDRALLQSLPRTSVDTETPWTEGIVHFEGVRMRDLLARLGAEGRKVIATGADDYRIEIPMADVQEYDVLIATAENGQPLRPDDKGPLWIVYPFSANPGLKKDTYFARCVWQLGGLTVQ